jgi:hypothetical protein
VTGTARRADRTIIRRVFSSWTIEIPASFAETFVDEGGYWHAYDAHRSISLTSMAVNDEHGPVSAERIMRQLRPVKRKGGAPVDELPPSCVGWAITADALQPARASRMLSGMLALDGRVLIATITSDDLDWARSTWLSIRACPSGLPGGERH